MTLLDRKHSILKALHSGRLVPEAEQPVGVIAGRSRCSASFELVLSVHLHNLRVGSPCSSMPANLLFQIGLDFRVDGATISGITTGPASSQDYVLRGRYGLDPSAETTS